MANILCRGAELAARTPLVRQHVILVMSFHFFRLYWGNFPPGSAALNSLATEAGGHERVALARSFGLEHRRINAR
jgi:hypothetical protein